jgi:hypothetical protein
MAQKICKKCGQVHDSELKGPMEVFGTENWIARQSDWSYDWERKDRENAPFVCKNCGKFNY